MRTVASHSRATAGHPTADRDSGRADSLDPEVSPDTDPDTSAIPDRLDAPSRHAVRAFIRAHRRLFSFLLAGALVTGFVIGVLPQITGLGNTLNRMGRGNHLWLLVGVVLGSISIGGYIALFRSVFSCEGTRIGWKASYEITLAGVVATKLLAAAGAGGIALTAWALRASGLSGRTIAQRMAGFEVFLYTIFMVALLIVGLLLGTVGVVISLLNPSTTDYVAALAASWIVLSRTVLASQGAREWRPTARCRRLASRSGRYSVKPRRCHFADDEPASPPRTWLQPADANAR